MTEYRFQFIPEQIPSGGHSIDTNVNAANQCNVNGDFVEIEFEGGEKVEVDLAGGGSYYFEADSLEADQLKSEFETAVDLLDAIIEESELDYTVCLLVVSEDPWNTYKQEKRSIELFGENVLMTLDQRYAELSENAAKVSFRRGQKRVTI